MFGVNLDRMIHVDEDYYSLEDYLRQKPKWCPGCGDHAVLTAIQKVMRDEQLAPENVVFVSGAGCASQFPLYVKTYGFHGLHGRGFPIAEGIKIRRPDLHVFVAMGDMDTFSIGAGHWIHAMRYNMDMVALIHDNHIYGEIKTEASPTAPTGLVTDSTPHGMKLPPLNPLAIALSNRPSFVAQVAEWMPAVLYDVIRQAYHHKGFSFIRILQRCARFSQEHLNPDPNRLLLLTHPDGIHPDPALKRILKHQQEHNPRDLTGAFELAYRTDLIPIGILYQDKTQPCYEDLMAPQDTFTPQRIREGIEAEFDRFQTEDGLLELKGSEALALGLMASGMEVCAVYPIRPATSTVQYLARVYENVGGVLHQAEDEIAACSFALGASYAGKCAATITSSPGMLLKSEGIALASMAEIPLVVVDVQRAGPSVGMPIKVEQGDLMLSIYGGNGDSPRVVIAPTSVEDCYYTLIEARQIAEKFRLPVIVLPDADLVKTKATFARPVVSEAVLETKLDLRPVETGQKPYLWDAQTGLSPRILPGQPGGMHTVTAMTHDQASEMTVKPKVVAESLRARSLKLAAFQHTLKTPPVTGEPEGDLLLVGWGSTQAAIADAVKQAQADGLKVSALHLKFIQPLPGGIGEILTRFKRVVAVELNYSDDPEDELINAQNRRFSSLAVLLRARYLIDIESWSSATGMAFKAKDIRKMIDEQIDHLK
ncbi:MAG: hypothetical protein D6675_00230 [Gemmatimonadetes bacterium]|nr:MAG: hypothetical protein D6675_00230 [Gemmatimonadota bacterium]